MSSPRFPLTRSLPRLPKTNSVVAGVAVQTVVSRSRRAVRAQVAMLALMVLLTCAPQPRASLLGPDRPAPTRLNGPGCRYGTGHLSSGAQNHRTSRARRRCPHDKPDPEPG